MCVYAIQFIDSLKTGDKVMSNKQSTSQLSRRRFLALTGMTMAAGALAACAPVAAPAAAPAGDAASAPSTEGRNFSIFAANHHTDNVKGLWVPLFEEKTGAIVEWIEIGGGDADAKLAVFVASQDSTADVSYCWETFTAKYGRTLFEDLTEVVDAATLEALAPAAAKALSFLGTQYGIPFDSNQAIFMMNNDIYAEAGLDPASPPETWEQFMEYSEATTTDGRFATLFTLGDGNSSFVFYINLFNSTGGQLLNDDLTQLQINSPEGLLTMNAIYEAFVTRPVADPAGVTIASSIEQGKVFRAGNMAHYFAFPNHFTLANDPTQSEVVGKVTTSIAPGLSLRSGSVNAFEGYAINKFSENKDLGALWLEHIISPEVQKLVAINWGRPPVLLSTYEDAEVAEKSPQFATVRDQGAYPSPRYGSPFYFDLGTVFNQHLLTLVNDEITPQEAVDLIQAQGQQLIDDYWAKAA
jgi:ABC-type glycerol-3-phosphate transport system substrate-binding protein